MKIDNRTLAITILGGFLIVSYVTNKEKILEILSDHILITLAAAIAISIFCYLTIITVGKYIEQLKTKKKNKVTEALDLLNYKEYFPSDIAQTLDKYFSDESSNVALGGYYINDNAIEYYWAVSDMKVDNKYGETSDKANNNEQQENKKPIVFCKDKHTKIDFIIRGSEGELIPLSSSDISLISKIHSYSVAYYSCCERKIIGEFLSRHDKEIKSASKDECTFIIFTKRPPCKYCNDLIEYYRGAYSSNISFFVFDNLLLNLVNNDKLSHITFQNLDDAVNAVKEFEEKRKEKNLKKRKNERENQLLKNEFEKHNSTIEKYKHIIKKLIIKFRYDTESAPKKEEVKKICCITERHKEGITEAEFEKAWEIK